MSINSNVHKDHKILLKHVNFSKKLHKEVQNIENEVNWADIFNEETSHEVISSVVNQLIHDVNNLIYNLRQVMIKININQSSYNDLKELTNKLTKTSFNLQEVFGQEYAVIKSILIIQIQNIVKEVQCLLSIVEKDELHEFKTELVDSFSEILSDLQKVVIYSQMKQLTPEELEAAFNVSKEEFKNVVDANHFQHEMFADKTILEGIIRHTLHGVRSSQRLAFHLHNAANNYKDPIKEKINQAARNYHHVCMDISVGLYQLNRSGDGTSPFQKCMLDGYQAVRDVMQLMSLVNHCDKSGKDSENLNNLVVYVLANSLCLLRRFVRDMNMEVLEKM